MRKVLSVLQGVMLNMDFLKPLGLTQYRLTQEVGVPPQRIGDVMADKREVTADPAVLIA